jgi:hypothetical protein
MLLVYVPDFQALEQILSHPKVTGVYPIRMGELP